MLFGKRDPHRALERKLEYRFKDRELLELALTHRSYANELDLGGNYERLEFLGDAVLSLATADWLYRRRPGAAEGELSKLKSYLVSEPVLARLASELGLGDLMRLGVGEGRSGGRKKPSLLADALEAVIGAIYLDGGPEAAHGFVERLLVETHTEGGDWRRRDSKSMLQEHLQRVGRPLPRYVLVASDGPDHEKVFTIECRVGEEVISQGVGGSKKRAEQDAAESALDGLLDGS